jgi:O-methyltransferase
MRPENPSIEKHRVYSTARAAGHLEGAFAEVGVYRGASARLICEAKGDKQLHLFDRFESVPSAPHAGQDGCRSGSSRCNLESVREYLRGYRNVHFHKGAFAESARSLEDGTYAFVHFDVDSEESTLECLEHFYPRVVRGGIILSLDYDWAPGVRKAFDTFFAGKPERIVNQAGCIVVKAA